MFRFNNRLPKIKHLVMQIDNLALKKARIPMMDQMVLVLIIEIVN